MIQGIIPALLTPLNEDGTDVNYTTLHRLVEFHIQRGVRGFFVCGGSGEGLLLTPDERQAVLETVITAVNGRVSVIAHVGALDTATAQRLAAHAAGLKVDAVAAVPPFYFRVDEAALYDHYRLIADAAASTPVYLYNIPSATGVEITAAMMAKLITIPAVRGIKYTSSNFYDMRNIIELAPNELTVLSGSDEVCIAGLAMGAHGDRQHLQCDAGNLRGAVPGVSRRRSHRSSGASVSCQPRDQGAALGSADRRAQGDPVIVGLRLRRTAPSAAPNHGR